MLPSAEVHAIRNVCNCRAMTIRPTHFAINTSDLESTKDFYHSVFDWEFRDIGAPGFVQILDGENAMGSIQERRALVENPTLGFECTFGLSSSVSARSTGET